MTESTNPVVDVEVSAHGPYLVTGLPLVRRRDVVTEHDEPITTEITHRFDTRPTYALCRCGSSANKPFCDGTHSKVDFDGTETAPTSTYDARATTFEGTRLAMRDDRSICSKAGFCSNRATNVWDAMGGSATEDTIVRAQVIAMVERCPSGALTYRLEPHADDIEPDLRRTVVVVDDGPLHLAGMATVQRSDGKTFETRNRMALCRCGASSSKPLCDGTHRDTGFRDSKE